MNKLLTLLTRYPELGWLVPIPFCLPVLIIALAYLLWMGTFYK